MASAYEPIIKFWVKAEQPTGHGIFSFSEYLAAFALLMVVVTISDFRYRLRLDLAGRHTTRNAFFGSAALGLAILATDLWFHNQLPIPFFLNSAVNIKAALGLAFLVLVLSLYHPVFVSPPRFSKSSAVRFTEIAYKIIAEGDPSKIQTLLGELNSNLPSVLKLAGQRSANKENGNADPSSETGASNDLLLLLADPRVSDVVAKSSPRFAVELVRAYQSSGNKDVPISGFVRNASRAFFETSPQQSIWRNPDTILD